MTFCPNCGAVPAPDRIACPRCGRPAATPQRPALPVTNICAILGFALVWLPIPLAWLVLSVVGLVQCARTGQKGAGLAIAGILLRVLILAAIVGGIVFLVYNADLGMYFPEGWAWEDGFAFMGLGLR